MFTDDAASAANALVCDTDHLIEQMTLRQPNGPWVFTAINPLDPDAPVETRTFDPGDAFLIQWVHDYNVRRKWNIYYQPNAPKYKKRFDGHVRMSNATTGYLLTLHVDKDPDDSLPPDERQAALDAEVAALDPPPTIVDHTGNGRACYWLQEERIHITSEAHAEELGLYNKGLSKGVGGDKCTAVSWLMRAVGTINWPNKSKLKKGRVPCQSRNLSYHPERLYTLDHFTKWDENAEHDEVQEFQTKVQFRPQGITNIDLSCLDQFRINDRIKKIIQHGKVLGETKPEDDSGSAWQFEASCALVRRRVPDQLHCDLLMCTGFGWHETIKNHGGFNYAVRQITRAKEQVGDDIGLAQNEAIAKMNDEGCCVINLSGKVRYVFQTAHPQHPTQLIDNFAEKDAFKEWFADGDKVEVLKPIGGMMIPVKVPLANIYVAHEERRKLEGIKFMPGKDRIIDGKFLNTYSGFTVKPSTDGSCSRYLDLLGEIICNGKQERFDYMRGWMAGIIQKPYDLQQTCAPILTSPNKGAGKGIFAREFGKLLGRHFIAIAHQSHLVGNFNAHQAEGLLVFADETCELTDLKALGVLKTLVTEPTKVLERKGIDAVDVDNFARLLIASNSDNPIAIEFGDRRFFPMQVSEAQLQKRSYFGPIKKQMEEGGRAALLHYLLTYDISNFDAAAIPETEEKHRMILRSAPAFEGALILWALEAHLPGALVDRVGKNGQRLQDWPNVAPSKALYTALRESGGKALLHASDIELSAKLDDYGFKPKGLGDCAGKRAPDLHLLQAQLEKRYEALKGKWRYKEWGEVKDVQLKLAT